MINPEPHDKPCDQLLIVIVKEPRMNTHTQHDSTEAIKTATLNWTIKLVLRLKQAPQQQVERSDLTSVRDAPFSRRPTRAQSYYMNRRSVWIERTSWKQLLFFKSVTGLLSVVWNTLNNSQQSVEVLQAGHRTVAPPFQHPLPRPVTGGC